MREMVLQDLYEEESLIAAYARNPEFMWDLPLEWIDGLWGFHLPDRPYIEVDVDLYFASLERKKHDA